MNQPSPHRMTYLSETEDDNRERLDHQRFSDIDGMTAMLASAGIELAPDPRNPSRLRGNCPFHEPPIDTLSVDTAMERFSCVYCHRHGSLVVLAANLWKVSCDDAAKTLRDLEDSPTARRPTPATTPDNPNSAVINRLMRYFNHDLAINVTARNICQRLSLHAQKLANQNLGWCWPGQPMDPLMEQDVTPEEMQESNLLKRDDSGKWVTALPGGFVIPDLDRNRIASSLMGFNTRQGQPYFPVETRHPTLGVLRIPHATSLVHVVSHPLTYLKAIELELNAVLVCDTKQVGRVTSTIAGRTPENVAICAPMPETYEAEFAKFGIETTPPDERLTEYRSLLPRRVQGLRNRRPGSRRR